MRDPTTATTMDWVVLYLNDFLRDEVNSKLIKSRAQAAHHVDGQHTDLILVWRHEASQEPMTTPPVKHRSLAAPGDAYWIWPEEDLAEQIAAEAE